MRVKKFEVGEHCSSGRDAGHILLFNYMIRRGVYMPTTGHQYYDPLWYDMKEYINYLDRLSENSQSGGVIYLGEAEAPNELAIAFINSDKIQYDTDMEHPEFNNRLLEATEAARKLFEAVGLKL